MYVYGILNRWVKIKIFYIKSNTINQQKCK